MQESSPTVRRRVPIAKAWYLRILLFYAVMVLILTAVTYLVNSDSMPASAYELNADKPWTIVLATFTNGTWSHLGSNLYAMGYLLMGVLVLPIVDSTLMRSSRYLALVTWSQVVSGLLGASVYYAILLAYGIGPDGAGSSIINAGLIGIVILAFAKSAFRLARGKKLAGAALLAIILLTLLGELVQGFLQTGNSGAHYLGFVAGLLVAAWYLR